MLFQLSANGAQQPSSFRPCLLWPRSPISATAELLFHPVTVTEGQGHSTRQLSTLCLKNVPHFTCYNLDVHGSITIIFGKTVTEKVGNQQVLYFPTSLSYCFCPTWGSRKSRNCIFHLNAACFLPKKHMKYIKISLTTDLPFAVKMIDWVHPTGPRKRVGPIQSCCLLPTCSVLTKSVTVSVAV